MNNSYTLKKFLEFLEFVNQSFCKLIPVYLTCNLIFVLEKASYEIKFLECTYMIVITKNANCDNLFKFI